MRKKISPKTRLRILEWVKGHKRFTATAISNALNIDYWSVKKVLTDLLEKKVVSSERIVTYRTYFISHFYDSNYKPDYNVVSSEEELREEYKGMTGGDDDGETTKI